MAIGVSPADDGCYRDDGRIIPEIVLGHETVKTTAIAHMRKLDPRNIVRDSAGLCGDTNNLVWQDEEKLGLLVDEPSD
jgi:hypothetical protein